MHLNNISLVNFRNYERSEVCLNPQLNIIYGQNAQGKTNFLEAVYLLCLGRSFRQARNEELLRNGADYFTIDAELSIDCGFSKKVVVQYKREGKKEISIDRNRIKSNAAIFGQFPTIVMSPDDYRITTGGPSERRRFIDILLSQLSLTYLTDLQEYYRILKQRNRILQSCKEGKRIAEAAVVPWGENLIKVGSKILETRANFLEQFLPVVGPLYKSYSRSNDALTISIQSTVKQDAGHGLEQSFGLALSQSKFKEKLLGTTLVGPHRDDLLFMINGKDLRRFGSRGEHKSVLISLKLAEFQVLREKRAETPVLLLDDFRSELDDFREEKVLSSLDGFGQILLTSPTEQVLGERFLQTASFLDIAKFQVSQGSIELCN